MRSRTVRPAAALFLLLLLLLAAAPGAPAVTVDGVAAVVNGEVVTILELERAGRALVEERLRGAAEADRERVRREALLQVLDQLVATRLQAQRARQLGIGVSSQEVDTAIARIMEENHLTDAMLDRLLAERRVGREDYRREIEDQIRLSKLVQQEIRSRVTVGEPEVEAYYREHRRDWYRPERIRVRHLLVPLAPDAPPEAVAAAEAKVRAILAEARAGRDFAELVRENTPGARADEDPVSGEIARGELSAELEEAAFALAPGEVSEPVRTAAGFHLLQLAERIPAFEPTLEEMRDSITQKIGDRKTRERFDAWQKRLRDEAIVEILF